MARLVEHDRDEVIPLATSLTGSTSANTPAHDDLDGGTWPPLLAAPIAALAAFVLSAIAVAVPVFALWLTAADVGPAWDTWPEVAAITGTAWLAGQGIPVDITGLTVTLLPWGLAAIPLALLFWAGRWTARVGGISRPGPMLAATAAAVVTYAGLAVAVATWVDTVATGPGRVLATTAAISLVAFGTGTIRGARARVAGDRGSTDHGGNERGSTGQGAPQVLGMLPAWLRRIGAGAAVAVGAVLIPAALAVGVSLVVNSGQTHRLLMSLAPDAAGVAALVLLSLGYLPVIIGWATSYLLGTGFAISSGAVISPFASATDVALPVFPLLGAVPASPPVGAAALPVVGLIAGMLAAQTLKRRGARGWALLGETAAMIALAAAVLGAFLAASSGSLGTQSLSGIGPIIGPALGVATLLWAVGSLIMVIPVLASGHGIDDAAAATDPLRPAYGSGDHDPREGRRYGQHHA